MDITLALGGGGSRGNAHIGVLRFLEREGFRIRAIAGTSIGSIVAAFYAYGRTPDEIETIFAVTDLTRLYGWPLSDGPSLLGVHGISEWLKEHFGDAMFNELRLPCAAVAVDLNSSCEIILREGRLRDAILGSIAVPGIFPPKEYNEYRLIDGGTLDPVPVCAARELMPGLPVVAVVLSSPVAQPLVPWSVPLPVPPTIVQQLTRLRIAQAFGIFLNAVEIGQRSMAELRLEVDMPEVVIRPQVSNINLFEKVDVHAVARLGEVAAERALPDLKRAVSWPAQIRRRLLRR
jgi:NTE family protein